MSKDIVCWTCKFAKNMKANRTLRGTKEASCCLQLPFWAVWCHGGKQHIVTACLERLYNDFWFVRIKLLTKYRKKSHLFLYLFMQHQHYPIFIVTIKSNRHEHRMNDVSDIYHCDIVWISGNPQTTEVWQLTLPVVSISRKGFHI